MAVLDSNSTEVIRFSVFEVNLKAGELRRNGFRLRLQEQPFQILASLLERPGDVVTREQLRARLWPEDTFVDFDHSLNAAVRRLRDALGDSAESPRFVETIARRGYRFIAPVNGAAAVASPVVGGKRRLRARWPALASMGALVLVGIIVGWRAARHSTPSPITQERRLTANPTDTPILSSAISPDGKYLAFADKTGFYLRQVDSGETHQVSLPKNFDAQPAAWFADGSHLLATWVSGPQEPPSLWEVSVMGGTPRQLTDSGHDPSVSPDGSQIAFLRGSLGVPEVWLMQSDGGNPRKLFGQEEMPFGPVAWSPDGKRIAYYKSAYHFGMMSFDNQIKTLELATRRTQVIVADPHIGPGLAWTKTGRLIYSLTEPPPSQNDSNLWSLPIDTRTGRTTGPASRITRQPGYVGRVSVTADGKELSVMKFDWEPDVYIAKLEAHGTRLSPPQRLTLDDRMDFPYSWTPDSKSVFFASDRDGTFHVFKQAVDSAIAELVVGGDKPLTGPRLSPDGAMLIYLVTPKPEDSGTNVRLMRVPLAGGPPQFVLEGPGIVNQQCARLPSQSCLFSEISPGRETFFQFDPIRGTSQELQWATTEDRDPYNFNWSLSPDGKFLAIAKKAGVQKEPFIRVLSVADHTQKAIKVQAWAGISSIDWAADGKSLWTVTSTTRDTWALLNVDLDGRVRPMLEEKEMRIGWAIPSPDGRRLALWEASGGANAWLVENF
jgi:Tol biopolymer transport system component/DNA-binding winged helix-turn-helix (wHTH) protein